MPLLEHVNMSVVRVGSVPELWADRPGRDGREPNALWLVNAEDPWRLIGREDIVVRPSWVHWVAPADGGSTRLLAAQSRTDRNLGMRASEQLDRLDRQFCYPLTAAALDEWSGLYHLQHDARQRMVDFVAVSSPGLHDGRHAVTLWRRGRETVCGLVTEMADDALIVRHSAVHPERGPRTLARAMYLWAADLARSRRVRWVTIGSDVNFYGAVALAGLCAFKYRFGFRAVPADLLGLDRCRTVVERLTSLHDLGTPVLRLEYVRRRADAAGIDAFVDGPDALRLVSASRAGVNEPVLATLTQRRHVDMPAGVGSGVDR